MRHPASCAFLIASSYFAIYLSLDSLMNAMFYSDFAIGEFAIQETPPAFTGNLLVSGFLTAIFPPRNRFIREQSQPKILLIVVPLSV